MGRVSRHKKIKSIDPFSKASLSKRGGGGGITDARGDGFVLTEAAAGGEGKKGATLNRAPKKTEPSNIPRKLKELMAMKERLAGGGGGGGGGKAKEHKKGGEPGTSAAAAGDKSHLVKMEPLPGESMFSFKKRVRRELKKRLQELKSAKPLATVKNVSQGRKEYLQARADAKKRKKLGLPADAPLPGRMEEDGDSDGDDGDGGDTGRDHKKPLAGLKRRRPQDDDDGDDSDDEAGPNAAKKPRLGAVITDKERERARAADRPDEFPSADASLRFTDRAERPPEIKAQPRKSKKQREAEALHKVRQWAASKAEQIAASGAADDSAAGGKALEKAEAAVAKAEKAEADHAAKVRQEAVKKAQMEKLRAEAQAAYAALKKKRREEDATLYKGNGGIKPKQQGGSDVGRPSFASSSSFSSSRPSTGGSAGAGSGLTMGALRAGAAITAGFKPPQAS